MSSADQPADDLENGGGPVDHHPTVGRFSRRDLLRTGAAAGTAIGTGAGSVVAQDDSQSDDPTETDTASTTSGDAVSMLHVMARMDEVNGFVSGGTVDRLNIHQSAMLAKQTWDAIFVLMNNRLTDTATVASIEGRDAIARTYEQGGSESSALSNLNERVRAYFSEAPEHNIIEMANMLWLSYHALQQDGAQTDPTFTIATTGTDTNGDGYQITIAHESDALVEDATVTRHDGAEHEIGRGVAEADDNDFDGPTTVKCEVWDGSWTNDSSTKVGEFVPMSDEVLDSYDSSASHGEEFTIELDDGTTITTSLMLNIPNVGDPEETGAYSENVYDHGDLADVLNEIKSQSDMVVGNYDQTFVGELFQLMDDGELDPNDIRGSAGMARFLSGSDDASASSFQLALAQQLGVERADLSNVASMTVSYDGFLGQTVTRNDDGSRTIYHGNHQLGNEWAGQLFADSTENEVVSGETYAVNPTAYGAFRYDDLVREFNPQTGEITWTYDGMSAPVTVAANPNTKYLIAGSGGMASVEAIDRTSGEVAWSLSPPAESEKCLLDAAGETLYIACSDGTLMAVDPSDGSEKWSASPYGSINDLSFGPNEETLYAATDVGAAALDPSDGAEKWNAGTDGSSAVAASPDDEIVASAGVGAWRILDTADASQIWERTTSNTAHAVTVGPNAETIFTGDSEGNVNAVDRSDNSDLWNANPQGASDVYDLSIGPGGNLIVGGGSFAKLDPSNGTILANGPSESSYKAYGCIVDFPEHQRTAGALTNASFFDAPNGRSHSLTGGELTVETITDAEGNELESSDYTDPDYDTYDSQEYAEYIEHHTEIQKTIYQEQTTDFPWPSLPDGNWLPDLPLVAIALVAGAWVVLTGDD